jgi:acyl-CoA thioesterase I
MDIPPCGHAPLCGPRLEAASQHIFCYAPPMHRRVFVSLWVIALGVALVLAGCGKSGPRLPKVDAGGIILAFGDSLTFGTGATPEESYPAVLERLIARRVVRAGVPGEVTAEGLARLPETLDDIEPQLLILCLGGNDLLRKMDEAAATSNLRAMIKLARDKGIGVVLVAPPRPGFLTSIPKFYEDLAGELKIPLESEVLKQVLTDKSLKSDLAHPNAKGYAKIAEALAKLLKNAGAL